MDHGARRIRGAILELSEGNNFKRGNHPGSGGRGDWVFSVTGSGAYVADLAKVRVAWMNLTRASRHLRVPRIVGEDSVLGALQR
jgi:hypothetical protein